MECKRQHVEEDEQLLAAINTPNTYSYDVFRHHTKKQGLFKSVKEAFGDNGHNVDEIMFGKYKGKKFSEVIKLDKSYIEWVMKQKWLRLDTLEHLKTLF
jgi:putative heme iron utilization protein